ncbi:MAG TPA: hypothetical protein VE441_04910, partial [Mycobacterium sp.]|nr:hypothetical protein [Mycobacterium sp.]
MSRRDQRQVGDLATVVSAALSPAEGPAPRPGIGEFARRHPLSPARRSHPDPPDLAVVLPNGRPEGQRRWPSNSLPAAGPGPALTPRSQQIHVG